MTYAKTRRLGLIGLGIAAGLTGLNPPPAIAAAPKKTTGTVNMVPDPGNLSGVWVSARFNANRDAQQGGPKASAAEQAAIEAAYKAPPMLPWAQGIYDQRQLDAKNGHPYASPKSRCLPAGTPQSMFPPAALPIQILETHGQITILFEEFNQFRVIRMADKHLEDPDPGYFGDSIGHWEGDTLVVDTIGLNDKTTLGNLGTPHSEQLHVVERIRHTGQDTIEDQVTMTDPKTFNGVWKLKNDLKRVPGASIHEYYCENDRNTPDASGKSQALLPSASK